MTGAMMAFGIAVGIASLICYLLMTRLQNRRVVADPRDGFGWVGGADIGDGGSHFVWSGDNSAAVRSALQATVVEATAGEAAEGRRGRRRQRLTIRRNDLHSSCSAAP